MDLICIIRLRLIEEARYAKERKLLMRIVAMLTKIAQGNSFVPDFPLS